MDLMKAERQTHTDNDKDMLKAKTQKKDDYNREDMNNIAEVEKREDQLKQDVQDLREHLEVQKAALIEGYEHKMDRLHKELLLRMKVEIHEIEERKNQHINDLMK